MWNSDNQGDKETFIQTGRRGRDRLGREEAQQGGGPHRRVRDWQTRLPYILRKISQEEQLGSESDYTTEGSNVGNKALKPLAEQTCGS